MIFSKNLDIPVRALGDKRIPFDVLKYVPEESAVHYGFVPLDTKDGVLELGIVDPDNIEARDAIAFIASRVGMPFKIFLISQGDFDAVLQSYKGITGQVDKALTQINVEKKKEADLKGGVKEDVSDELLKEIAVKPGSGFVEEAPVTKIVAVIIQNAVEGLASDIHVEPTGDKVRVRFRVDGVLYTSLFLPISVHEAVVARIKILTSMKLDEKRKPQDGRFSARIEGRQVDFRVSTFPTYFGEKVVIRILDTEKGLKKLDQFGFTEKNLALIREAITRPYGLILLTGPTGSGKTTTLYSMLNETDKEKNNVVSLEDPIEYNMSGVSQSQVRPEIKYTFASGLRSILRQDPDIIMVGEIRDAVTARLAIQAALTGHLVFSTLHTNNAVAAIPRLIDMGIEPYLIAPTLSLVIAQRLVGVLCEESKSPIPVTQDIKDMAEKHFSDLPESVKKQLVIPQNVYNAVPSPTCSTGTRGRTAVIEILDVDKEIRNTILRSPTEQDIRKVARANGMITMKEDAMIKAFKGIIPMEEVLKI
ncbi:MAG: type II/IV secretion system protein [Candidatus Vogelbacteria bacterium]|nr:type II/IV secretion system protein [Candidatus Vogelbacteria bacterium]